MENNCPLVSVVMPVRNEADFIERSLRSVFAQTYPHSAMEIIVADGCSEDTTVELIEAAKGETDIDIMIVPNPDRIAPGGLNRAIAASKGSVVVRVDGHCEIDRAYVENCVRHLRSGKAEGVGGPIETIGETPRAEAVAFAMSCRFGVGGSAFRTIDDREMYVDTVAFPGYLRETLDAAGPFNTELVRNQDDEFNYRIRKMGGRILLAPDIRSRYYSRSTLGSLWRQYFQYGFWKVRVLQLHPKQMSLRQFVPFVFVLAIAVLILSSSVSTTARLGLGILALAYLAACIIAAFGAHKRVAFTNLPVVLAAFPILHISYGLGFARGLVFFRRRWNDVALPSPNSKPASS